MNDCGFLFHYCMTYLTTISSRSLFLMKENMFSLEDPFMRIFRPTVPDLKAVYKYTIKLDKYKKYIHK